MVAKLVFGFLFVLVNPIIGNSQIDKLEQIKRNNELVYSKENQIIKLTYISKTRFISKEIILNKLINLGSLEKNYQDFSFLDSFSRFYYRADSVNFYFKHRDSTNYLFSKFQKPFNLIKWVYPNDLFFLKFVPHIYNSEFFSKNLIAKTKIKKENDTYIITEKLKNSKKIRKVYTDNKLIINKIEYLDYDNENLNEKLTIKLSRYENTNLNNIGDSLKYGPFGSKTKYKKKETIKTKFEYNNGNLVLKLITNDSIVIDTNINKYYIVDFWFISCKPCHLFRPYLESLKNKINNNKAIVLGFDKDDNKDDLIKFIKIKKLKIPELNQTDLTLSNFDVQIFPTILILDNQFNIVRKIEGYSETNELLLEKYFKELKLLD